MVHRSAAASHQHTRPPYGNHSHGHVGHRRQPREPPVERQEGSQLSEIKLVDLDRLRPEVKIGIPPSVSRLSKISAFLRRKYRGGVHSIENDAGISFYHGGDAVHDDRIPRAIAVLYYRAARSGTSRSLRLLWSDRLAFHPPEVNELMDRIEAGITMRELRADIAACLGVDDSSRVVVSARDGLRPGLLQGDNWEARRVGTWLCQTLFVDLVAERNYVVVRGVNEEYIFHPFSCARSIGTRTLKTWLHDRILTNFVQEEGWLVPEKETCIVCSDDKRISEFPARIAKTCGHQPATCRGCIGQWIASSMASVPWDRLKCPECSGLLAFEDVRAFADPETFESVLVQPPQLALARGETCAAYDRRTRRQRKSEKASEKKVKEMTKSCPRCHKDVYKYSGCDHIT
ncbi:hypothetical protein PG997_004021 [Apiospora hydei]|uniref:RING-type domain-containing protein n=1 Tax=Apiospora hydei TaxID=1337664 RepID=A0ABR1X0W0_9PEZI